MPYPIQAACRTWAGDPWWEQRRRAVCAGTWPPPAATGSYRRRSTPYTHGTPYITPRSEQGRDQRQWKYQNCVLNICMLLSSEYLYNRLLWVSIALTDLSKTSAWHTQQSKIHCSVLWLWICTINTVKINLLLNVYIFTKTTRGDKCASQIQICEAHLSRF